MKHTKISIVAISLYSCLLMPLWAADLAPTRDYYCGEAGMYGALDDYLQGFLQKFSYLGYTPYGDWSFSGVGMAANCPNNNIPVYLHYMTAPGDQLPGQRAIAAGHDICSANQYFFPEAHNCLDVTQVPANFSPAGEPANNGGSCPANRTLKEPCVKDPVNPGTGNMWLSEQDYTAQGASGLWLSRTYNSGPYNPDAGLTRSFGTDWTQVYDAVLKQEAAPQSGTSSVTCWQRSDNGYVFCQYPTAPASQPIPAAVSITRGDGKKYLFVQSGNAWIASGNVNDRITASFNADHSAVTGWTYLSANGDNVEQYDASGKLIQMTARNGTTQRLTYSNGTSNDTSAGRIPADSPVCTHVQAGAVLPAGRLLCVTDNWGRQLQFEYDNQGRISKAIDPSNQATIYAYDGPSGGCVVPDTTNRACSASNLTQVTYPDGKSKTYYYNEAGQINNGTACANMVAIGNGFGHLLNALTGIVDENGIRTLNWTYDCQGRVTSNYRAGGVDKATLAYGPISNGASTTTVTHYTGDPANPQASVQQYSYQQVLGIAKNTGIDQPCAECGPLKSRSYDTSGNVTATIDWNGNQTTYQYDLTRNLEMQRIEAAGTPDARTITTQWHPTYRLPTLIAEPKRITTFSYDSSGNLLTKTVQATSDATGSQGINASPVGTSRTWSYSYNQYGQVLTATDPNNNTMQYTYDAASGNLLSMKNAAGHVTSYSNYDANGRVGHIVDANGLATDLTYSPRGWLLNKAVSGNGINEVTSYHYDGVGQLLNVSLPDGSSVSYTYDPAHRLTDIADSSGNTIHYVLDAMGNRTNEQVKDPTGNLSRQVTRIYDALNRLQTVTGAVQ